MTSRIAAVQRAKYSHGPSSTATFARGAVSSAATARLAMVARKLEKIPMPKARVARPLFAIGYPSKHVAMLDGLPGTFNNVEAINPPEQPPT